MTRLASVLRNLLVVSLCLAMALPLLWVALSALKSNDEILKRPFALPQSFRFTNFTEAWRVGSLPKYFLNSAGVAIAGTALCLIVAAAAAYALARWRFRGDRIVLALFLLGLIVPSQAAVIPLFVLLRSLNLLDSLSGLTFVYVAWQLPFSIYVLRAFILNLPGELEEAGLMDGCSPSAVFWRIVLPVMRPALAVVAIVAALTFWNEFLFALLFLQTEERKTLPLGLLAYSGSYTTDYRLLFSALTIATLPMVALFFACQRQFMQGLTAGAVKG